MNLGKFSYSVSTKDIEKSLEFYETLGFKIVTGGHVENPAFPDTDTVKWRMLEKDGIRIGIFQGMFPRPTLSFETDDGLAIQETMVAKGYTPMMKIDPEKKKSGFGIEDPDGNVLIFGQM